MKKILFAASECVPFIKTGGLADVCGALPKEFDPEYWDVRVVIPNYSCIPEKFRSKFEYVTHFYMSAGNYIQDKYVGVLQYKLDGVTYYFIDNEEYFTCSAPYGDIRFDIEKFVFFDKAVLSMLPLIDFQPQIIHCHDWETGLIPVYLKNEFQGNSFFWGMKSIITIHNLKFQGVWDCETMEGLTGFSKSLFTPDKLEFKKDANMLKGGIVYADYITTVSDSYANEIQMPFYGEGLDGLLSARHFDMQGIVNGIDYDSYNPETDSKIFTNYNKDNFRKKKASNKEKLQEELGLAVDKKKYMIGLVSRLTDQKGLDLVNCVMDGIVDEFTQFVVIGTGDAQYENMFRHYAWKYPDRVSANICYSDELARKLYAAADAFLMPSLFEPCGLTQLISFRYGTVPIVRETGGLKDTVIPYNEYENTGDGFSFTNYNAHEMLNIINYSKHIYYDKKRAWNQIIDRGIQKDFSWNASKFRYEGLYDYLLGLYD
ncbi:MAG: glycogen synthase GlgA [Lachnospiraceae bacterium]|nr:glycogen synthase GlgA [Lachnospiraceae bacterium]